MQPLSFLNLFLIGANFVSGSVIRSAAPVAQGEPSPAPTVATITSSSSGSTLITSTVVVNGSTGTMVWQATTLSGYEGLKASRTITTTFETTSTISQASTTTTQLGTETVVAVVFAGGVAWWAACKSQVLTQ